MSEQRGLSQAEIANGYLVLEQVMQFCVDEGRELLAKREWSEFDKGRAWALYCTLDRARIQADLFLEINGADGLTGYVRAFDPEDLMRGLAKRDNRR